MTTTSVKTKYQPILSIKDKHFSIYHLQQYHLAFSIGNTSFRISCIDQTTSRCLLLEGYRLDYSHITERISTIRQLCQEHPFLAAKVWNAVTLCIENQQYTVIPKPLFQEKNTADYLNLAFSIGSNTVRHFVHPNLDVVVAFAIEPSLLRWFQTTYDQASFYTIHQASSLIEGVFSYLKAKRLRASPRLFILAESKYIHITVIKKANLLYYNRFSYSNSDEFLRYILIVMHTLGLDPGSSEVILGGNITKNSLAYRKARSYIRKVVFSDRPPYLKFRCAFKKSIITNYFDILSVYRC